MMNKKAGEILQQYVEELKLRMESAPQEEQRIKQEYKEKYQKKHLVLQLIGQAE